MRCDPHIKSRVNGDLGVNTDWDVIEDKSFLGEDTASEVANAPSLTRRDSRTVAGV
jgi:hypothetical protein